MNHHQIYFRALRDKVLEIGFTSTTSLNMALSVNSGSGMDVDWESNGTIVNIVTNNSFVTKTFGTATSGVTKVLQPSRITTFRSTSTAWFGNLNQFLLCPNLATLVLSGNWAGNIASLSPTLTQFQHVTGSGGVNGSFGSLNNAIQIFLANRAGTNITCTQAQLSAKTALVSLNLGGISGYEGDLSALATTAINVTLAGSLSGGIGNHKLTYSTSKTWATNFQVLFLRPLAGFGLPKADGERLLIDMNNDITTGSGAKSIDIRGNNAAIDPTITAVASAISGLQAKGFTVLYNSI